MTMRSTIIAARVGGPTPQPDGSNAFEFRFAAGEPVFAGHFPGRPLLPGVFQLEMARLSAEWVLGCPLAAGEIGKAKFQRPILPGELVRLSLKVTEQDAVVDVRSVCTIDGQPAGEAFLRLSRVQ